MQQAGMIYGVLVTFRRRRSLADTLTRILSQTRPPDRLLVIDNESSPATRSVVGQFSDRFCSVDICYLGTPENLGSAGGWAFGIEKALERAGDEDWILPLDDDNPPQSATEIQTLADSAERIRDTKPNLAGVGVVGARFNWRTGFITRVPDHELDGTVEVDFLGTGNLPLYSVAAIRDMGTFEPKLFFGFTELEYGLRLRRSGFHLFAHGEMWRARREQSGRIGLDLQPSRKCSPNWKRYYVIRNYTYMMRRFGRWDLALKQAAIQTVLKPAFTMLSNPRLAIRGFRLGMKASVDGLLGRMGRRVEPVLDAEAEAQEKSRLALTPTAETTEALPTV